MVAEKAKPRLLQLTRTFQIHEIHGRTTLWPATKRKR